MEAPNHSRQMMLLYNNVAKKRQQYGLKNLSSILALRGNGIREPGRPPAAKEIRSQHFPAEQW